MPTLARLTTAALAATLLSACAVSVTPRPASLRVAVHEVPTSKEQCKRGGWRELVTEEGRVFENQGDCVSYVARGR